MIFLKLSVVSYSGLNCQLSVKLKAIFQSTVKHYFIDSMDAYGKFFRE